MRKLVWKVWEYLAFFGLVAFAYAHKSKEDIAKLEQDIEGLKAMLKQIQTDKS